MGIKYKIDKLSGEGGRLHVAGWAVSREKRPITWTLSTRHGEPVRTAKYYPVERPDISRLFFRTTDYVDCGFEIEADIGEVRTILLNLSDGIETISVTLAPYGVINRLKRYRRNLREFQSSRPYRKWFQEQRVTGRELALQRQEESGPLISVVVPVYRTPLPFLKAMVKSIQNQSYANWQLCLSNSGARGGEVEYYLERLSDKDPRIRVAEETGQLGISENTNQAISLAEGDYIGFMDHDDLLEPDALYQVARAIKRYPGAIAFYTDEDKISEDGRFHFDPHFKPDFDRHLLLTNNYISHFFVVNRAGLPEEELRLRDSMDGSQDYDLILRVTRDCQESLVKHIPRILYHWRSHPGSTAAVREAKGYTAEAGLRALQDYCKVNPDWQPEMAGEEGYYRIRLLEPEETPGISVIFRNVGSLQDMPILEEAVRAFGSGPTEVILETGAGLNRRPRGQWLFFADAAWIQTLPDCFRKMTALMKLQGVGAVTGQLADENHVICNAGVHLEGRGGARVAVSSFSGYFQEQISYGNLTRLRHQVFGAMPVFLLISRKLYEAAGSPVVSRMSPEEVLLSGARIGEAAMEQGLSVVYEPEAVVTVKSWPYPVRVQAKTIAATDPFFPPQIHQKENGNLGVQI